MGLGGRAFILLVFMAIVAGTVGYFIYLWLLPKFQKTAINIEKRYDKYYKETMSTSKSKNKKRKT